MSHHHRFLEFRYFHKKAASMDFSSFPTPPLSSPFLSSVLVSSRLLLRWNDIQVLAHQITNSSTSLIRQSWYKLSYQLGRKGKGKGKIAHQRWECAGRHEGVHGRDSISSSKWKREDSLSESFLFLYPLHPPPLSLLYPFLHPPYLPSTLNSLFQPLRQFFSIC